MDFWTVGPWIGFFIGLDWIVVLIVSQTISAKVRILVAGLS